MAIPFVRDFDFQYGRLDRLSPRVERVIAANPGPFTFTGTGTYIVGGLGAETVAVIDPGPLDNDHLRALRDAIGGRRVSAILATHTHLDHSPLCTPLKRATGAPILAAAPPEQRTTASLTDTGQDEVFMPDRILSDGDLIEGDGWSLRVMATPGHASNHLAFVLPEENALFSGDHVMGWSTTVVAPPDGDMADYMKSLDRVIEGGFDILYPTHGAPIVEPAAFLDAYRAHRLDRERAILTLTAGGVSIAGIVPVLYAAVDRGLWPAAAQSVRAHLDKLVAEGRVRVEAKGPEGALYFS